MFDWKKFGKTAAFTFVVAALPDLIMAVVERLRRDKK